LNIASTNFAAQVWRYVELKVVINWNQCYQHSLVSIKFTTGRPAWHCWQCPFSQNGSFYIFPSTTWV